MRVCLFACFFSPFVKFSTSLHFSTSLVFLCTGSSPSRWKESSARWKISKPYCFRRDPTSGLGPAGWDPWAPLTVPCSEKCFCPLTPFVCRARMEEEKLQPPNSVDLLFLTAPPRLHSSLAHLPHTPQKHPYHKGLPGEHFRMNQAFIFFLSKHLK